MVCLAALGLHQSNGGKGLRALGLELKDSGFRVLSVGFVVQLGWKFRGLGLK